MSLPRRKNEFFVMIMLTIAINLVCSVAVYAGTTELIWDEDPSWTSTKAVTSFAVRSGDLNNDGYPDVIQSDYYAQIDIYLNDAGVLPASPSWTSDDPTGRFRDVQLGDMNGDGFLDMVATKEYDNRVYIIFNQDGQFNLRPDWASDNLGNSCYRAKPFDIDRDGDIDLLVSRGGGPLYLLRNDSGTLTKSPVWASAERFRWFSQFDAADYDGDGAIEVAVPNMFKDDEAQYRTYVYKYNASTGGLDVVWKSPPAGGPSGLTAVTHAYWADYENDGDLDLFTSDGAVYLNTNGVLAAEPITYFNLSGNYGMTVGDYNKDGLVDVIITRHVPHTSFNYIFYFENSSAGLAQKQRITVSPLVSLAENIDYDRDGDLDLLLTYFGYARIYSNRIVEHTNQNPTANAGPDQTVECAGPNGASVTLDGSASYDPDGDALTYTWTWNGGSASGVSPTINLPYGTTTVTLTVDDGNVGTASDEVKINVVDTVPPLLNVTLNPNILWPPTHKYVTVTPSITVSDACTVTIAVQRLSASSSEPDNGLGDGDTANDIVINADGTISLRAERSGTGSGRVYTITYQATDIGGNTTTTSATVAVPHNK